MNSLKEYTITKSTVESYKIRHPSGMYWADITVDGEDRQVRIQIASDWGDYQYYWGACGPGFKVFLQEIDMYYAAGKFGADRWFDHDKTITNWKNNVIEYRRQGDLEEAEARDIYDEIKELEEEGDYNNDQMFISHAMTKDAMVEFFDCDGLCSVVYDITPQFRKFWATAWQVFLQELARTEEISVSR